MNEVVDEVYSYLKSEMEKTKGQSYALAYSGGLDSSLLFALSDYKLIPYSLGFSDSRDIGHGIRGIRYTASGAYTLFKGI